MPDMEKLEMAAPVEVTIRRNADGQTRTYVDECGVIAYPDGTPNEFLWSDGNYGCDCNRALLFVRCDGEDDPDIPCSDGLYSVRLKYKGEVFYDEFEPAAGEPG